MKPDANPTKAPPSVPEVNKTSISNDKFLFDCEHLVAFCTNFEKSEIEDQTDSLLEVKLEDLENRWKKLQVTYENLMVSSEISNSKDFKEKAKINFNACSEAYYAARSQITDILRISVGTVNHNDRPRYSSAASTSYINQHSQNTTVDYSNSCIKVPPCDTEVFKGGYEEWPSFRDMFTAVYINHPKLTRAQKLYHLRNKTQGMAGAIVKRYLLCDENFDLAWKALKSRYENTRVLVDNQLKVLFDIPTATRENSDSIQKIHSSVNDCLATLRTLNVNIDGWDPILIYLVSTKLPDETLALWEQSLTSHRDLPKWSQMDDFLMNRFEIVERIHSIKSTKQRYSLPTQSKSNIQTYLSQEKLNTICKLCEMDHSIRICPKFRTLTVQERVDFAYQNKFCNNCLSSAHTKLNCKSKNTCIYCRKPHHSLLHIKYDKSPSPATKVEHPYENHQTDQRVNNKTIDRVQTQNTPTNSQSSTSKQAIKSQIHSNYSSNTDTILLRTALVQIEHRGDLFTVRALIDSGSQRSFISEKIRSRLQIRSHKSHFDIIGIGGQRQTSNKECEVVLFSKRFNKKFTINAIVLPKVTKRLPAVSFDIQNPAELRELDLADPYFNKSSQIDMILGSDSERFINIDGIRKDICGDTSAYNTIFGWVLSGPIRTQVHSFTTTVAPSDDVTLSETLRKFWEQEEIPKIPPISAENKFCEDFYRTTTTRQPDGRYMVRLPFKKDFPGVMHLGSSRFLALGQYTRMEQTLRKTPELSDQYNLVLKEYLSLGHMDLTTPIEIMNEGKYFSCYLPHHAVVRPDHKTTKVRIVFNASRKTKSSFSLNDVLCTGPTLQSDLMTTILNWRKYKYVFSGDIQKMYRQISIHPLDRPYQRILFKESDDGPVKDFELKTVTFGINCAPFLAIRTLLQLASDSEAQYPKAASILRKETYVDDILSGGFSIEEVRSTQAELIAILQSAGFPLKKITANDTQLLSHLPPEDLYDLNFLRFHETSSTKTLGVKWNAVTDSFSYSFSPLPQYQNATKRKILSSVAQMFDPAGWIAPIVIRAKILMQQLWLEGLQWDEEISTDSLQRWNSLVAEFPHIQEISIPRWLQYIPSDTIQIHGFSDASKAAYCAAVYIRCKTSTPVTFSNLLVAKTKVAPLQPVCLPRLELNGAFLLATLVNYIRTTFDFPIDDIFLWTDSTIVLGWLSKPPWSWETYVANRTAKIHELVPNAKWRHVPTNDNPADLGTRGCKPHELVHNKMWWQGPSWLTNPPSSWPMRNQLWSIERGKKIQVLQVSIEESDILTRFSSYHKALRVLSYVFRFVFHGLHKYRSNNCHSSLNLTQKEVTFVKTRLITLTQKLFFESEYNSVYNQKPLSDKSTLKTLNPFLDSNNIMRVNGRLSNSLLSYNERYPIILPGRSHLCDLYLSHLHTFLAHGECNQMCRMVQTEFYISRLKPRIKSIIYKCKVCTIFKHKAGCQIMAPLPPERCTLTPPFHVTGIDFAGPFELKSSQIRTAPMMKGYVCVFVCFSTKAIHLEPCSDLSSASFEAAFARFVGRRGLPHRIVCDNGRNFVGASRALLREFTQFLNCVSTDISQKYSSHGFEWSFIPPHAPHMGGLWEAAVKSFKYHFKRIAGSHKFTFEQLSTVLARIEGVLNSRPISAISEDPSDLTALTPGHFLKGTPIMALPEPLSQNLSLINRWEKLKALHHQFAIRWKEDYLKALHKRYKWKNSTSNIKIGDLVVVIDDLLPPSEWRLGRVDKTYLGSDSNVRVADVRIATGLITRPIVKLCFLPLLKDNDSHAY